MYYIIWSYNIIKLMKELQIVSYNILADYLNSHKYIMVDEKYLDNDNRIKLLLFKLKKLLDNNKNTIVCLQEVGPMQLSFLHVFFSKYNYSSINFKDLAIYYPNEYKVTSVKINSIKKLANKYLLGKNKLIEKVSNFNNAYIIIQLKTKHFKEITVCTTHITSNPKFSDIKILQSYLIARKLEKYKRVIFCGDFNSKPDSKVYELLNNGSTKYPYYGKLKIKNKFSSSYKLLYGDELNITTHTSNLFTRKFTETIDYIWITPDLIPINSLSINTREEIDNNYKNKNKNFMPNKTEPSDHYCLAVTMSVVN
jgi:mRNA deadenylase 3'-5' endonuclease subunit Ccr4